MITLYESYCTIDSRCITVQYNMVLDTVRQKQIFNLCSFYLTKTRCISPLLVSYGVSLRSNFLGKFWPEASRVYCMTLNYHISVSVPAVWAITGHYIFMCYYLGLEIRWISGDKLPREPDEISRMISPTFANSCCNASILHCTNRCHCNVIEYQIFHTVLQWLSQNINQRFNLKQVSYTSPSWAGWNSLNKKLKLKPFIIILDFHLFYT